MPAAVDRVVFSTECVTIGAFRCATSHPSFRNSGPIRDDCFVFPRTTVVIQHDNARAFVADPTVITLYNRRPALRAARDLRRRRPVRLVRRLARTCCAPRWPIAIRRPPRHERPIRFTHARADASTYLEQRRLFIDASDCAGVDALDVEERVVALLDRVLTLAYRDARASAARASVRLAAELADAAKRLDRAARRRSG